MFKSNIRRYILTSVMLLAAFVMSLVGYSVPVSAEGSAAAAENAGSDWLQFTSAGHVLGFSSGGTIIASSSHMLKTEFIHANPIKPQADTKGDTRDFSRVSYNDLWTGVDLVYAASPGAILKSTYYISSDEIAGAVEQIRLQYNRPVKLDISGNLVTAFDTGSITESRPLAWQEVGGEKRTVEASYRLYPDNEVGFTIEDYLPGLPLAIDPAITWNTFLGATSGDEAFAVAVDGSGNVYVTGDSNESWGGAPVRAYGGGADAFVAKLDSNGGLTWNTFLGKAGSADVGRGIAVDGAGNVYVAGESSATWGTPVRFYTGGVDAFAAKLDSNGALTWNTFLGAAGADVGYGIALDAGNNVYVVGDSRATWGAQVRSYTAGVDSFAAKLDTDGGLIWNTFLGGNGDDGGYGITVDATSVYICGQSSAAWGNPVRAFSGAINACVTKMNSTTGALTWNTFLGSSDEAGYGIAVDAGGKVYVTGRSNSTWGTPVRAYSVGTDAFVAKLGSNGALTWNTFLGGTGTDLSWAMAVDNSGYVYTAGYSTAAWGSATPAYAGSIDGYVVKLDSTSGVLNWNAFVGGGTSVDTCTGVALDGSGNIYVVGQSTGTWGSPLRAYSNNDAYAARLTNPTNVIVNPGVGGTFTPVNRLLLVAVLVALALAVIGGPCLALRRRKGR
jgi:hypothetical protein